MGPPRARCGSPCGHCLERQLPRLNDAIGVRLEDDEHSNVERWDTVGGGKSAEGGELGLSLRVLHCALHFDALPVGGLDVGGLAGRAESLPSVGQVNELLGVVAGGQVVGPGRSPFLQLGLRRGVPAEGLLVGEGAPGLSGMGFSLVDDSVVAGRVALADRWMGS